MGYVAYSRTGYGRGFTAVPHRVTQVFEGADDLDIPPAVNGRTVRVGRVWCAAETDIEGALAPEAHDWDADSEMLVELVEPQGGVLTSQRWTASRPTAGRFRGRVRHSGWHEARVTASGLPGPGRMPYVLTLTYTATPNLR